MTDKPIIFSGPMVRALLDGRKTQTRRVLKPQPRGEQPKNWTRENDKAVPYAPGDRLYVREAIDKVSEPGEVFYRADYEAGGNDGTGLGWRPSIHMPRWASRLTLTVTDVRVQRLQEISEEDARAEGIKEVSPARFDYHDHAEIRFTTARAAFRDLWNSLHGRDAWAANPWVAALTFTVERRNIDGPRP